MSRIEFGRFVIEVVAVDRLDLLDKNARFMTNETFKRLVENVKTDGQLSQIPFCVRLGDRFKVLSGNHRVMAARAAGLAEIPIIYTAEALSRDREIAIQLSHNAIAGEDDPAILKSLWDELQAVGEKLYSGLDDKMLALLAAVSMPAISEVKLDFKSVAFMFLPEELPAMRTAFDEAVKLVSAHDIHLARLADYDRLLGALATANKSHNVTNSATGILCMLAIFQKHLTDLQEGWLDPETGEAKHKGWVPISTVFATDLMPAPAAAILVRALKLAVLEEDVTPESKWKVLELWAADYLAGDGRPMDLSRVVPIEEGRLKRSKEVH